MKTMILAATILAIPASAAGPFPPKAVECDPVTGICVPPPTVSCVVPLLWNGNACVCQDGSPPVGSHLKPDGSAICAPAATCTMTVTYPSDKPATATLHGPGGARCDAAGAELALAALLAKRLGAP